MDENELFRKQVAFTYRMHRKLIREIVELSVCFKDDPSLKDLRELPNIGLMGVVARCLAELMARETQEALGEWSDNFLKGQENKK